MSARRRVAFLPAGGPATASSRLRAYLPCRYLNSLGQPCEIFDPKHPERYGVAVFQKRYDEANRQLALDLRRRGIRTIFDLCDNHYHYELDRPREQTERAHLLDQMIESVDLITVSTPTLGRIVEERTGRVPLVIDDAVEWPRWRGLLSLWRRLSRLRSSPAIRLVWFGAAGMAAPPFGLVDLGRILPLLEELGEELPVHLEVISNSEALFRRYLGQTRLPLSYSGWSQRRFPFQLLRNDIVVVPVNPNPLTLCKTSNRPVLALVLGLPVVADAIPSYEELSGFVMLSRWHEGLRSYASRPALRRSHVHSGRAFVKERFAPGLIARQWAQVFERALGGAPDPQTLLDPVRCT